MPLCGGIGEDQKATPEVQNICNQVKAQTEHKAGQNFGTFTAMSYKSQLVAGTNYFIKVHVGGEEYVHLRVYRTLPHAGSKLELTSVQIPKAKNDPIEYF